MEVIEIIRMIGAEFESVADDELNKWIELAKPWVSQNKFGDLYNQALAFMVCHRLKVSGKGVDPLNGLGSVAIGLTVGSVSEGGSSISYGASQSSSLTIDAELATTVYGVQFLQLRRGVIVPITCGDMI